MPNILTLCSAVIEHEGAVEGIYRLSGFPSVVQRLRHMFETEDEATLRERCQRESTIALRKSALMCNALQLGGAQGDSGGQGHSGGHSGRNVGPDSGRNVGSNSGANAPGDTGEQGEGDGATDGGVQTRSRRTVALSRPGITSQELPWYQDIYALAGTLKMYFRELPNPLFTYELYKDFQVSYLYRYRPVFLFLFTWKTISLVTGSFIMRSFPWGFTT